MTKLSAAVALGATALSLVATAAATTPGAQAASQPATHVATLTSAAPSTTVSKGGAVSYRMRQRHRHINGTSTSINWAGYGQAVNGTRSISASFVVPAVATNPTGLASSWVGIDGLNNQYLAQTGISEEAVHGRTAYYGWWEIITPSKVLPEQTFRFPIKPGQRVTAVVSISRGTATMTLFNNTTGFKAVKAYPYSGPGQSAEWIQEDVYLQGRISPAPNWKSITFINARRNGVSPHLNYKQTVDIVDHNGNKQTNTSYPSKSGDSFKVTWLRGGTWTPVTN